MLGSVNPDAEAQADLIAAEMLTEPCRILRDVVTRAGDGSFIHTWAPIATTTCSIPRSLAFQELERTGVVSQVARFRAQFPADTDLRGRDRVEAVGLTFEVLGTDRGISGPALLNATLARIGEGGR
jgi:hypothetical protein